MLSATQSETGPAFSLSWSSFGHWLLLPFPMVLSTIYPLCNLREFYPIPSYTVTKLQSKNMFPGALLSGSTSFFPFSLLWNSQLQEGERKQKSNRPGWPPYTSGFLTRTKGEPEIRQNKFPTLLGEFWSGKIFLISLVIYFILAYLILLGITWVFKRYSSSKVIFLYWGKSLFYLKQTVVLYTWYSVPFVIC